ncbi:MAG: hypothetical protein AB8G99_26125 [Planctomycetaceae bacterium]
MRFSSVLTIVLVLASVASATATQVEDKTITPPDRRDLQTEVLQAITKIGVNDAAASDRIGKLWGQKNDATPRDTLELVVKSFAAVHPETGRFVDQCRFDRPVFVVPKMPKLDNAPQVYSANLGLFYGRYLARRRLYDESLAVLSKLNPKNVSDPATFLFFKAVCEQQLLRKNDGLQTLTQLLENTIGVPTSYRQIAELMQYELKELQDKSLEEIAQMMGDVGRRLDLGRGGKRVQRKEEEIIARLDEMIEEMEQQQQQGGGGGGAGSQGGQQATPTGGAQASRVKGSKGEGEADRKKLAGKGGWGMLDSKAETKARASIKRKFPAHYGEAIKRYNIKLAK